MKQVFAMALALLAALARPAAAEVDEIKIGKQYGLPYIQFVIMEDQKVIEKNAKLHGLGDIKVNWATLGGPAQLNDGIISGAIDVAAVGLPNLITMWEKTRTNVKVRAIAGLNFMPLLLVTRDPQIKTLKDYGEKDRIDRKSTRLNSSHQIISYAVFCLKKKKKTTLQGEQTTETAKKLNSLGVHYPPEQGRHYIGSNLTHRWQQSSSLARSSRKMTRHMH